MFPCDHLFPMYDHRVFMPHLAPCIRRSGLAKYVGDTLQYPNNVPHT